jgi:hypothetical protein
MGSLTRSLIVTSLFLAPGVALHAQNAADPSGHWEGTLKLPNMEMKVEIDMAKNGTGDFGGTFGQPEQGVKGLPLSTVAVDGTAVKFVVKGGPEPATFEGTLAADGTSIAGSVSQAGYSIPFTLARTGAARFTTVPKSVAIGKELEGTWNGAIDVNGTPMRLIVKMANQGDGTSAGTVVSPDGSGVEIPIAMTQKASSVTIDVPSVNATFAGTLNAAGTEVVGTWTQQQVSLPLTLRHTADK